MPVYRNDSKGTIIIKNLDGAPCPVGPKEIVVTLKEINFPGLSMIDSEPEPKKE